MIASQRVKRLIDFLAAAGLLLLLSPLFAALGLAIRLDSAGAVFFRQKRVGRGGRTFLMYKFRSMVEDAPERGPYFTNVGDPRITRLGKILRKTSLDELPQLINVLWGEMSLVGPRPDVPAQMGDYTEEERDVRHRVSPGITGLAQVTYRNEATADQRKGLDLDYVHRNSILLDFRILLLTVRQVLLRGSF